MNKINPLVYLFAVLFIVSMVGPKVMQKLISDKLVKYLYSGNFEEFDNLIKKKSTKLFINPFNIDYLKLNKAMMTGNKNAIDKAFQRFDEVALNKNQKMLVYNNAFYYYASLNSKGYAKKYCDLLCALPDFDRDEEITQFYNITCEKSTEGLEDLLEQLEEASGQEKSQIEFLISRIYDNMGDKENTKKYLDLSLEHAVNKK